ncbi:MAG: hypothetical protein Q4B57_00460 [Eubacteriales bacterium]|nr:hypothetical protein [Eubacteriales bacterium]
MDSMFSMIDIIIAACGVYILYIWYLLKFKGEIKESMLLPKDLPVKKCSDKAAYIAEMSWKVLLYGIVVLLCGALGVWQDTYGSLGIVYFGCLVIFVGVTIWFALQTKKAVKKYWP